jgi:DNA-binding CsgD family transcriptional regulator
MGNLITPRIITTTSLSAFILDLKSKMDFIGAWELTCQFFAEHGQPWVCFGFSKSSGIQLHSSISHDGARPWLNQEMNGCHIDKTILTFVHGGIPKLDSIATCETTRAAWADHKYALERSVETITVVPISRGRSSMDSLFMISGAFPRQDHAGFLKNSRDRITLAVHHAESRLIELSQREKPDEPNLSPREKQCLLWLARGLHSDGIAERLGISLPTVKLHLLNARKKFGARTREQALALAVNMGVIDL